MPTRRYFLKTTAIIGAGSLLLNGRAWPFDQSPTLPGIPKFDATLPGLGPAQANNYGNYITVLSPNTAKCPGVDYYEITLSQFNQVLHPNIGTTAFWSYADAKTGDKKYLGGLIVAKRNRPVKLKLTNLLPATHILPYDSTYVDPTMSAEVGGRVDRAAIHLHGGLLHWTSDGGPFAWFSNANNPGGFVRGSSFLNGAGRGAAIYDYPNVQSARLLWYHDHAYAITRLNAYAGVATGYLITDDAETLMVKSGLLPDIGGVFPLGIPLILQDKTFVSQQAIDKGYPGLQRIGSLWYPWIYESPGTGQSLPSMTIPPQCDGTGRWDWDSSKLPPPPVSGVAEAFMDTTLINGAPFPRLPVAPRRYRFRILNAAQARFYNLQLYVADPSNPDGINLQPSATEVDPNGNPILIPTNPPGPKIIQIGTEGGFLPAPVVLNDPPLPLGWKFTADPNDPTNGNAKRFNLLLGPAERADILIDFRGFEGRQIILYSDAPAPFPGGDIRNDYYPGAPDLTCIGGAPTPQPGFGPDTRVLMRFDVSNSGSIRELTFNQTLATLKASLPLTFLATQPQPLAVDHRPVLVKSLNETFDDYGRLTQKLGVNVGGTGYLDSPTEVAHRGEVQVWQIYNFTADVHPMHFHLVNVQIVKREQWQFTVDPILGTIPAQPLAPIPGTARPPDPNERGWKETVRMNPGEVITVIMKFDLPSGAVPNSPRLKASYGINGAEYVWHCHILEHEEHDMMHALVVV